MHKAVSQAWIGAIAGAGAGESVKTAGSQAYLDKNQGNNKIVRASGVTIKDSGNADVSANYNINYVDNTSSVIDKADLTVTAIQTTKGWSEKLSVKTISGNKLSPCENRIDLFEKSLSF